MRSRVEGFVGKSKKVKSDSLLPIEIPPCRINFSGNLYRTVLLSLNDTFQHINSGRKDKV